MTGLCDRMECGTISREKGHKEQWTLWGNHEFSVGHGESEVTSYPRGNGK